ncbi:putative leader peptide [Streptomyces sp. NBC_01455]
MAGPHLTARSTYRQPDRMPLELLLFERVHVDLARTASACCAVC